MDLLETEMELELMLRKELFLLVLTQVALLPYQVQAQQTSKAQS